VLSHIFKTDGHPANSCGRWFQDVSHVAAYFRLVVPHKKNPQHYNHSKAFLLPGNLLLQWKIAMLNRQVTENHHTKWAYMGIFHSHFQLVTSGGGGWLPIFPEWVETSRRIICNMFEAD